MCQYHGCLAYSTVIYSTNYEAVVLNSAYDTSSHISQERRSSSTRRKTNMKTASRIVPHIVTINDYISVPDCTTTGTVKDIQAGHLNPPLMIYEIETTQGMMRLAADRLEK